MASNTDSAVSASLAHYQLGEFPAHWARVKRGLEKESLRVLPSGRISTASHPRTLGSALTNPYITTDFSESLLEFITPAHTDIDQCLKELQEIHSFTIRRLEQDEMLWVSSMPCPLDAGDIRLAQYGKSNIGQLKTLYRQGLSHRYGSLMQVISGLHYNFSMPEEFWPEFQQQVGHSGSLTEFRTERYLHLIRNFHRYSWLLLYLFGASPAACTCFAQRPDHGLEVWDESTLYLPHATCLRMGRLGYKSEAQKSLFVCYNELDTYVQCLDEAMHTPFADYEAIDRAGNGELRQINTNLLQLENEFYSTIRPKRVGRSGERPLDALTRDGIEYIEVRALDLNPFLPLGIDAQQMRFLDAFLLHCLLAESPVCDQREFFEVAENLSRVVDRGRDPALELSLEDQPRNLRDWASELLTGISHAATLLDSSGEGDAHQQAVQLQQAKVADPALTPSGQMLKEMERNGQSFFQFAMERSRQIHQQLRDAPLAPAREQQMEQEAAESIARQAEIEAADEVDFPTFLANWNAA